MVEKRFEIWPISNGDFSRMDRGPNGEDEPAIRLKYDDETFINFPYDPKVYDSAWDFFNQYWDHKRLTSSRNIISRTPSTLSRPDLAEKHGLP